MNSITQPSPIDQTRLFLVKGKKIAACHACKKSFMRVMMIPCGECKHNFCRGCVDACRCYSKGFRMNLSFWKRSAPAAPARTLALVR